ncbi:neuroligin-2-like [Bacillus rossius redtenbacheri]|uniref:neuroligin-2-like n=1 Tax=Bacillus rossius redtenbacheri TaxID=93214 RepID=UPI002FDE2848
MPRGRLQHLRRLLPLLSDQSEDCLYLNIYAPVQAGSREAAVPKYPVLVFIHGESYEWNSGNPYDGSVLASYGSLVVITVNYRLGVLGFLNANSEPRQRAPANYGLMDQVAALHWVQENIAAFGGDPSNVTVLGHGTGAACLHFLMASSAVPDGLLFHRAVLMSGSALSPWSLVRSPARYAAQVARHAGCPAQLQHAQLLRCLRERPLQLLVGAPVRAPRYSPAFGPSVDGVVVDSGEPPGAGVQPPARAEASGPQQTTGSALLDSVLLRKSAVARLNRYHLLLGVARAEAYSAFSADDVQYGLEPERRAKVLRAYVQQAYRYHQAEILATVVNEYTDWERPVQHPVAVRDETMEALGDAQVVAPVVRTADLHAAAPRRRPYLYVFEYQTKYGDYPQRQGCVHGEELAYLFGAPLVGGFAHFPRNYTKAELLLAETVMTYWSSFAWSGNPNEPQDPEPHGAHRVKARLKTVEWPAYEPVHKKYLSLDLKPRVKSHYRAHRLSFWLSLVPELHRPGGGEVPPSHHLLDLRDRPSPSPPPPAPAEPSPAAAASTAPSPAAAAGTTAPPPAAARRPEDGFAAYSTALSLTVAIGCSLLVLNVLVFAGVYYRRDKPGRPQGGAGDGSASPPPPAAAAADKNGRLPNSYPAAQRHLYPLAEYPPPRPVPPPAPPPPPLESPAADGTARTGL